MLDVQNFTTTYEREIETKPRNKVTLFALIFILNLAAFGYTGVYKGFQAASLKREKIGEFRQVSRDLDGNYEKIGIYKNYISAREPELSILRKAIPSELESAEYLTQVNEAANFHGYIIERMEIDNRDPNVIVVSMRMQGPFDTVQDLVKEVESLERLTIIDAVRMEPSNEQYGLLDVSFNFRIFVS